MKTVFKNNSEVCHVWASQSQETGKASNINFINESIYSYGHWIMAKFINNNTVLIRDWSYSSSTGKHLGHVRHSIPDYINTIYCYNPENISESLTESILSLIDNYNKFDKATKNKLWIYKSNQRTIKNINEYLTATKKKGILNTVNHYNNRLPKGLKYKTIIKKYTLSDQHKAEAEAQQIKIKEREAEKERVFNENLNKLNAYILNNKTVETEYNRQLKMWRNGEINNINTYNVIKAAFEHDKTFEQLYRATYKKNTYYLHSLINNKNVLRIYNNQVETNQNATVSIKEAQLLWHRIKQGKDIKGVKVGYYTVISFNGELKIGCHNFERKEVERFGKVLDKL